MKTDRKNMKFETGIEQEIDVVGVWKGVYNSEDLFPQSPFSHRVTGASRIVMFKMAFYSFVNFHTFPNSVD